MNSINGIHPEQRDKTCRLRILATSDLHMQLSSFDYVKARNSRGASLAKVASLIKKSRKQALTQGDASILVDNGDTWQGTPLADFLSRQTDTTVNPMAHALNYLGYDALGMGNHDFDFGIDYLSRCLTQASISAVCTNMNSDLLPEISDALILDRLVKCENGTTDTIRIGILSTAPDLTSTWNQHHLSGKVRFSRPLPAIRQGATRLRHQGADIVLVLAHMGFEVADKAPNSQNELASVAALSEVDAVVGGHTHQRFPDTSDTLTKPQLLSRGLVQGTPVVQPGPAGCDLGQISLVLNKAGGSNRWSVRDAKSELIRVEEHTPEDRKILELVQPAHVKTRSSLNRRAARIAKPMNTYFALACPSPVQGLLAAAKRHVIQRSVAGTELADLPLLASASATLTGGLDGPDNFISLKGGVIKYRHVAGMTPYPNHVWAVRCTGAHLLDWLERSVIIFNTLTAENPDQLLINKPVPGFRYDAIFGLTYEIDPRQLPRFDQAGQSIPGRNGRVSAVTWQGEPLDLDQEFLVATTDHRAGGGGNYQPFSEQDILVRGHCPVQTGLLEYLENPSCEEVRLTKPWRLKPNMDVTAILLSAPDSTNHFEDISSFGPEDCGLTDDGFQRIRLHL